MRDCYHTPCDDFNRENITNMKYKFLTTITEALILTVMEMAVSGRVSESELGKCKFSLDTHRKDEHHSSSKVG